MTTGPDSMLSLSMPDALAALRQSTTAPTFTA
jgi:hypothetical protein